MTEKAILEILIAEFPGLVNGEAVDGYALTERLQELLKETQLWIDS